MPTIKIPFPIHEGFEVKNATIDLENGYTVVEYGEKEVQAINNYILVPDNIGIYKWAGAGSYNNGDGLHIGFNDNTQSLGYSSKNKGSCFVVYAVFGDWKKIKCKLIPCKRGDLKAGDTAVIYQKNIPNPDLTMISRYYKVLPNDKYAKVDGESISIVTIEGKYLFFKVEPIQ